MVVFIPVLLLLGYLGSSILEKYAQQYRLAKYLGYFLTIGITPIFILSCIYYSGGYEALVNTFLFFILPLAIVLYLLKDKNKPQ